MATTVMRNVQTGEYRSVEADSPEFWELRAEMQTSGRPRWEQTGHHDLAARQAREQAGVLREEDFGDDVGPRVLSTTPRDESVPGLDHGVPTPGELEQNAGRARFLADDDGEVKPPREAGPVVTSGTSGSDIATGYPGGLPTPVPLDEGSGMGEVEVEAPDPEALEVDSTVPGAEQNEGGVSSAESGDNDNGPLRGQALDDALEEAGLSKSGTVAEKQERLRAHQEGEDGDDEER